MTTPFKWLIAILVALGVLLPTAAKAQSLPIPRFVSLTSSEVNMRTGPGTRYPIQWVYTKVGLPVEVINEFDTWRKIRDIQGDEGWVHQSMLSGRRHAIVKNAQEKLLSSTEEGAMVIARLEPGVLIQLSECQQQWCKASVQNYNGWIKKSAIWGVYEEEIFD